MTALRTRNKAHAKYEAACGLDDIIGLLYPELRARAAIDGKAFPCPICGPENLQKLRLVSGRKNTKPYWKCSAKHQGDKHCDTVDFIRESLRMKYAEAISLWAALANTEKDAWQSVIEAERPNWYLHQGEAKWTDELLAQDGAEQIASDVLRNDERTYFKPNALNEALGIYRKSLNGKGSVA